MLVRPCFGVAALQLAGEEDVGELRGGVRRPPAPTLLELQVAEVEGICADVQQRGDVDDARVGGFEDAFEQQPGEQEVAEVVDLERALDAVFGDHAL